MKCRFVFHKKFTKPWRCSVATSPQSQLFCVSHFHHEKAYLNLEIASQETQRKLIANNLFSADETQHRKKTRKNPFEERDKKPQKKKKKPKKRSRRRKKERKPAQEEEQQTKARHILKLSVPFTKDELRIAFKQEAFLWHPDKHPSCDTTEKMKEINWAFSYLMGDDNKHFEYPE